MLDAVHDEVDAAAARTDTGSAYSSTSIDIRASILPQVPRRIPAPRSPRQPSSTRVTKVSGV